MAYKMAPNLEAVFELISSLREYAYPAAKQEFEELTQFAKSEGFHDELMNWDLHFWSERLREKKYQYAEEDLMQYLSLENVLEGLFNLTERLFGVVIIPADGKADVWDSDVRFFEIYEKDSKQYIASFYLDAYSRPDEKSEGAWMDVCLGKSKVIGISPVAYINCNGSPPMRGRPSLMSLREVENLFHEFGHGLQHMLSCVPHGDASGIRKMEWDAIELASQFMENWCYDRDTFFTFAKHYQTGEPSPEDLYHKVKAAKNFHAGTKLLRQLYFAALDLMLHSKCNGDSFLSPFDLQANIAADFAILPPLENDRFLCSFRHVFGGGYAAGYYGYIWAEVMSADAFAAFEEVGLENKDLVIFKYCARVLQYLTGGDIVQVREMGRKFRKSILALGGGEHPTKVYQLFRGKQASPDALLRHLGLKEKKQTLDLTKDLATSSSCHMETAVALQKRRE